MKAIIVAVAVLAGSSASLARDSCGLQVAKLMAKPDAASLERLFKRADAGTRTGLAQQIERAGTLSDLSDREVSAGSAT